VYDKELALDRSKDNTQDVFPVIPSCEIDHYLATYNIPNTTRRSFYTNQHIYDWHRGKHKLDYRNTVSDEPHTLMSASNFELVETHNATLAEQEARGAIAGTAGHQITYLITEMARQFQLTQKINTITATRSSIKTHEREIMEQCRKKIIADKSFNFQDIPQVAFQIWKELKPNYIFYKKPTNSKHLALFTGNQYSAEWVAWQWNFNPEQNAFEEAVFGIHSLQMKRFMEQDLFDPNPIPIPVETCISIPLVTEKPLFYRVSQGGFKTMYKGQADWVLDYPQREEDIKVVIDQKYTNPKNLSGIPNRLQVLTYSLAAESCGGKINIDRITLPKTIFLYQVYDFSTSQYYYLDASIKEDELPTLLDHFWHYSATWWGGQTFFKKLDYEADRALIMPHLPYPDELDKLNAGFIEGAKVSV